MSFIDNSIKLYDDIVENNTKLYNLIIDNINKDGEDKKEKYIQLFIERRDLFYTQIQQSFTKENPNNQNDISYVFSLIDSIISNDNTFTYEVVCDIHTLLKTYITTYQKLDNLQQNNLFNINVILKDNITIPFSIRNINSLQEYTLLKQTLQIVNKYISIIQTIFQEQNDISNINIDDITKINKELIEKLNKLKELQLLIIPDGMMQLKPELVINFCLFVPITLNLIIKKFENIIFNIKKKNNLQ